MTTSTGQHVLSHDSIHRTTYFSYNKTRGGVSCHMTTSTGQRVLSYDNIYRTTYRIILIIKQRGVSCDMTTFTEQHIFQEKNRRVVFCYSTWQHLLDKVSCHMSTSIRHSPLFFLWKKYVVLWMLSCDRTRCPVDVFMSQDTSCGCFHVTGHSLLFYYGKNMLYYRCCHVTEHVVLWMLSCHMTPCGCCHVMFYYCWKRDSLV